MTDYQALASAAVLLVLGAMSPGPSLAVVVRNTTSGGRWQGLQCALGHGLGFGLYALAVVFGLVVVMREAPFVFVLVQGLGALLLVYLGWLTLSAAAAQPPHADDLSPGRSVRGFVEGFLTAILNPKIALFFLALFSSVLHPDMSRATQFAMAALGWLIDSSWYALVAVVLSTAPMLALLRRQARVIDLIMGWLLIGLGAGALINLFWP